MNNPVMFPTVEILAGSDSVLFPAAKQQWISETRIEMEKPVDWLNVKHLGKATHFMSSYAAHRFKIHFPTSGLISGSYGFLTHIVLNFFTTGRAALTNVELYEDKYLLWISDDLKLHGDHTFALPPDNYWEIDPGLPFTDDLRLELVVSFGAPNHKVPEFRFYGVHARFEC